MFLYSVGTYITPMQKRRNWVALWKTSQNNFPMFVSIVDDEEDLLYLFRDALSQIPNVTVFAFTDPRLALTHFQANHNNYVCVISDFRMPAITGTELLEEVKEINPQVKRILISAFEVSDEAFATCKCIDAFLQKPLRMVDLIKEVQSLLTALNIRLA